MPRAGAINPTGGHGATKSRSADHPNSGSESASPQRSLNPTVLAYAMGPLALVVILLLMHFGDVARESAWLWVAVFIVVPMISVLGNHIYDRKPSEARLHVRVASGALAVTIVIYLSGWGPVLAGAFAFLALENIAHGGSRVWRITALWSLVGIAVGQVAIGAGWAPSELRTSQANALALMGAFILVFIIRMAGMAMEKKEDAETSTRLSEDRFRSLIQNSSDATLVISDEGLITYASPAVTPLLGFEPDDLLDRRATDYVHPDERDRVMDRLGSQLQISPESLPLQFRMEHKDGTWRDVEAVVANQCDRPSVGGYVANVRDITERKEFEALLAHRALHDPLTGLANRQLILDRAEQMLARSRRTFDPPSAYFIDLDNFKDANDSLGHEAGDKILQAVADRFAPLAAHLRHARSSGWRRVRDPDRWWATGASAHGGGRACPRGPAYPVPRRRFRRSARHGDGECRDCHRDSVLGSRAPPRRRHCAVSGQGIRAGSLRPLRDGHAVSRAPPPRAQIGPRLGPGQR